ncbi:hypothetical protein [Rothia nasimurium]|uniref:hypothetical protein n=1 Tax=Rothia nasimurium TaxID=85336 RepID=UPI001F47BAB8|nr:hypothetical protein [Rothia nasimurium]
MDFHFFMSSLLGVIEGYISLLFGIFGVPLLTVMGFITLRSQHRKNKLTIEQLERAKSKEQQNHKNL